MLTLREPSLYRPQCYRVAIDGVTVIGSFSPVLSGIGAAAKRFDVASSNIVHAFDTGPSHPGRVSPVGPAEAARAYRDPVYRPRDVVQTTNADGGTRADTVERKPAEKPAYKPDDPFADKEGLVARPNVDLASEFVNIILAQRAYEAAFKALAARDKVLGVTIDARS
jgi:flagellar basal-body rod protein FlgC